MNCTSNYSHNALLAGTESERYCCSRVEFDPNIDFPTVGRPDGSDSYLSNRTASLGLENLGTAPKALESKKK